MRTTRKRLATTSLLVGCLALLTSSCTSSPPTPTAVAIVKGAHANAPAPAWSPTVQDAVQGAAASGGSVAVIVADGVPWAAGTVTYQPVTGNSVTREDLLQAAASQTEAVYSPAVAENPQSDLLTALDLAGDAVAGAPGDRVVIVQDSGLSTAGPLDFRAGALDVPPEQVIARLRDEAALPHLRGVRVVFEGLGQTAPPQAPLTIPARADLETLWVDLVRAGGGQAAIEHGAVAAAPVSGVPGVDSVQVAQLPPVDGQTPTSPVVLHDSTVGFAPDSAALRDQDQAAAALRTLAQAVTAAHAAVDVTGTTSSEGGEAHNLLLSRQRADAIKALLVQDGVPAQDIRAQGVGTHFPGFVEDRSGGVLDPVLAAANRTVQIRVHA